MIVGRDAVKIDTRSLADISAYVAIILLSAPYYVVILTIFHPRFAICGAKLYLPISWIRFISLSSSPSIPRQNLSTNFYPRYGSAVVPSVARRPSPAGPTAFLARRCWRRSAAATLMCMKAPLRRAHFGDGG